LRANGLALLRILDADGRRGFDAYLVGEDDEDGVGSLTVHDTNVKSWLATGLLELHQEPRLP